MGADFHEAHQIDPSNISSRADLAEYLSRSLPGEYKTVVDDEVRQTATHVKSYLLEAHPDGDASLADRLGSIFSSATPLPDKSLLRAYDQKDFVYFFDLQHPRFQVMHSIEVGRQTDTTFHRLTEGDVAGFDHVWMPRRFLEEVRRGELAGFKFRYETAVAGATAIDMDAVNVSTGEIVGDWRGRQRFRMEVAEDVTADREYARLMQLPVFTGRKALEQIQFRSTDADEPGDYVVNSLYSYGKVVGKGTSIGGHFLTIDTVLDAYEAVLSRIEEDFALGWVSHNGGHTLRGEPFVFRFPKDVEIYDLTAFAASVFSGTRPFRLLGIPHGASHSRIDVEAIDLHTGDPLSIELSPEWMRVYLPRGSCGNIIARLLTNMQRAVSSEVSLLVGDEIDPFRVESAHVR